MSGEGVGNGGNAMNDFLQELGNDAGYLKAGFMGFQGSGKTFTATLLAIGVKKYFDLAGPVALFDTEAGSPYISKMVEEATGQKMVGRRSRAFDDLLKVGRACEENGVSVLIVDSITHVWRELGKAYLKQVNDRQRQKIERAGGIFSPRQRLEFQDWSNIKDKWAEWTDFFLNSPLHIIICGRAGYEYDFEDREDGTGKDLVKTGIKMKVEGEFGYEPSLLVNMERHQTVDGVSTSITRRAMIIKDRFNLIDGKSFDNPTFDSFLPHVQSLTPGGHVVIDTAVKSDAGVGEDGESAWKREQKERVVLCEEIQGELLRAWPGQKAEEKKAKTEAIETAFGTRSWTKVEGMDSATLRSGLAKVREIVGASKWTSTDSKESEVA